MANLPLPTVRLPSHSTIDLGLQREGQAVAAVWSSASDDLSTLEATAADWLHPAELARLSELRFTARRRSFLLGRRAAQQALQHLLGLPEGERLEIRSGVFGFPVVASTDARRPQVSLSHTGEVAVAVAFFEDHPLGIDIEAISVDRMETVLRHASAHERALLEALDCAPEVATTVLWTCKESLSKILRTGLMTPLEVYELDNLTAHGEGCWTASFRNFAQYRAEAGIAGYAVQALALPRRTMLGRADVFRHVATA
ncbi:MAG: 4'-phosphopantetheinyl transferase superfamily protein [Verrucomicrobiota bacterium JB022]|nr:4'-phosphopantetheinyl transferase superfamily protein [Verrucomicrobiota bacterium JB022]